MGAWKRRTPVLFAAAGALFVMSASCTTGGGPLALSTGLEIDVLKWPTEPVGRDGERDTAPVSGAGVLVESLAGGSTRRATTDSAGIARVQAVPGTHRVSVERCPGAMSLPKQAEVVSVAAGSFSSVTLI